LWNMIYMVTGSIPVSSTYEQDLCVFSFIYLLSFLRFANTCLTPCYHSLRERKVQFRIVTFLYPFGHFGFTPVTFFPILPLTQVIVVFLVTVTGLATGVGDTEDEGVGVGFAFSFSIASFASAAATKSSASFKISR